VGGLLGAGYFLGSFPWVKTHLNLVLIAIIVISLLPAGFAWLQQRLQPAGNPAP
jgi:membrane-associated protein